MGRHISVYKEQCKLKLCDPFKQKKADNVYISLFRGLSLREYITARIYNCQSCHMQPCSECQPLLSVASRVLNEGFCMLSEGFKSAFPNQVYKSDIAIQRFLQMPLASIRVGTPQSGKAAWFLVEYVEGVDYTNFAQYSESIFKLMNLSTPIGMDRDKIKALLGLATSDRERELIRYAVFKTSGLSQTSARKQFGFESMDTRAEQVEKCIETVQGIREAIDKLSLVQDKALLAAMGLKAESSSSESETETKSQTASSCNILLPSFETLKEVLQQGQYNWFTVVDFIEQGDKFISDSMLETHLKEFYSFVLELPIESQQKEQVTTSYLKVTIFNGY